MKIIFEKLKNKLLLFRWSHAKSDCCLCMTKIYDYTDCITKQLKSKNNIEKSKWNSGARDAMQREFPFSSFEKLMLYVV